MSADAIDNLLISYKKTHNSDEINNFESKFCNIIENYSKRKNDWRNFNYSYYYANNKLSEIKKVLNCNFR